MRLQVWGDPIAHSKSPAVHTAAYRELGLDWEYGRRQVSEAAFAAELAGLGGEYRGLSLTMPLKEKAYAAATTHDERAVRTGSVNTLLLTNDGAHGFNTDVAGFIAALAENGVHEVTKARVVGAGATAASALAALTELGAERIEIVARTPAKAGALVERARSWGVDVTAAALDAPQLSDLDVTIATLPGGTTLDPKTATRLADAGGTLIDAVYAPWPTQLAERFAASGARTASGQAMLLHQAVAQVRIFVGGDPAVALRNEAAVVSVMRSALMGD